jgi:putative transcriptional regulator
MKTVSLVAFLHFLVLSLLGGAIDTVRAAELADTVVLVATPELGAGYTRTVLIARRVAHGRHLGVILNRPTRMTLATLFPEHAPSKKVADPLYFGGPVATGAVFALVRTTENPGEGSLQLGPDLFLATTDTVIDRIIDRQPDRARFYAGVVVWEPGELAAEIERGYWFVRPVDRGVVFRKHTEGLWEELVRRAQGVTASLAVSRRS